MLKSNGQQYDTLAREMNGKIGYWKIWNSFCACAEGIELKMITTKSLVIVGLGMILMSFAIVLLPGDQVFQLTDEDGLIEWAGAVLFLTASIFFLLTFIQFKRSSGSIIFRWPWSVLLLSLFFFISFGEEVSWLQRYIGLETPEKLREYNIQEEFNLHNLKWFNGQDIDGIPVTGLSALFTAKRMFIYFCAFFFLVIPVLNKFNIYFRKWFERIRIPVLPLWIGVLFLLNLVLTKVFQLVGFYDAPEIRHALVEIMEANFAVVAFVESWWIYCLGEIP